MKKPVRKVKSLVKRKLDDFNGWFIDKDYPYCKLNKNVFFHNLLKLIGLVLVFLIIYFNVDKINQIILVFIKLGSLLQLVLLFFILRKAWHLTINLKYAFRGLNHGTKAIIAIVIVLLLFMAFLNQDKVVNSIIQTYEETNFSKLNPIQISGSFSIFKPNKNLNLTSVIPDNVLGMGCAAIEVLGESQGVSNMKSKACREMCGKEDKEYYSYECVKDKLICYCKE